MWTNDTKTVQVGYEYSGSMQAYSTVYVSYDIEVVCVD